MIFQLWPSVSKKDKDSAFCTLQVSQPLPPTATTPTTQKTWKPFVNTRKLPLHLYPLNIFSYHPTPNAITVPKAKPKTANAHKPRTLPNATQIKPSAPPPPAATQNRQPYRPPGAQFLSASRLQLFLVWGKLGHRLTFNKIKQNALGLPRFFFLFHASLFLRFLTGVLFFPPSRSFFTTH